MMSLFNNLRMPAKIGLITAVLGAVMIARQQVGEAYQG